MLNKQEFVAWGAVAFRFSVYEEIVFTITNDKLALIWPRFDKDRFLTLYFYFSAKLFLSIFEESHVTDVEYFRIFDWRSFYDFCT